MDERDEMMIELEKLKGKAKAEKMSQIIEKKQEIEDLEGEEVDEAKFKGYVDENEDEFNYD